MAIRAFHSYVIVICLIASTLLFFQDWSILESLSSAQLLGAVFLVAIGFFSECIALAVRSAGHSSIAFLPLLACQVLFGTAVTAMFVLVVYSAIELVVRKKSALRVAFNLGQLTLAVILSGLMFRMLGGVAVAAATSSGSIDVTTQLIPFFAFTGIFLGSNHLAVTGAIALDQGIAFRRVWRNRAGRAAINSIYDMLVSPIALGVAFLFVQLGAVGILVALLPLLFVRHAYLTTYRLQQANQDLLKALVKAIETRDPYTSGHSQRVSQLAVRIAEGMGLSQRKVDSIEAAALLHDIGKIESVYTEILKKPGNLTTEERAIIQSHVLKGVELLESLASFSDHVIAAVRHHHERVDGKGYPDGLRGEEISLGGRIIKVCDAIDAMLSDRPYRTALSLSAVREQLTMYAGMQFDSGIVEVVANSTILEDHQADLRSMHESSSEKGSADSCPGVEARGHREGHPLAT